MGFNVIDNGDFCRRAEAVLNRASACNPILARALAMIGNAAIVRMRVFTGLRPTRPCRVCPALRRHRSRGKFLRGQWWRGRAITWTGMRQSSKTIAPEGNREAPPSQRCAERQAGCGSWQGNKNTPITVYLGKISSVLSRPGFRAHTTQVSLKFPER